MSLFSAPRSRRFRPGQSDGRDAPIRRMSRCLASDVALDVLFKVPLVRPLSDQRDEKIRGAWNGLTIARLRAALGRGKLCRALARTRRTPSVRAVSRRRTSCGPAASSCASLLQIVERAIRPACWSLSRGDTTRSYGYVCETTPYMGSRCILPRDCYFSRTAADVAGSGRSRLCSGWQRVFLVVRNSAVLCAVAFSHHRRTGSYASCLRNARVITTAHEP